MYESNYSSQLAKGTDLFLLFEKDTLFNWGKKRETEVIKKIH